MTQPSNQSPIELMEDCDDWIGDDNDETRVFDETAFRDKLKEYFK